MNPGTIYHSPGPATAYPNPVGGKSVYLGLGRRHQPCMPSVRVDAPPLKHRIFDPVMEPTTSANRTVLPHPHQNETPQESAARKALAPFEREGLRVDVLFDSGKEEFVEDLIVVNADQGIVGVFDGVSEFYSPSSPRRFFDGRSGGQIVGQVVKDTIQSSTKNNCLIDTIRRANKNTADRLTMLGYPLDRPEQLPGVTAGVLKFDFQSATVEIVAWGDTLVSWQTRSGEFGGTANQVFAHDRETASLLAGLSTKNHGDVGKAWDEYLPMVLPLRAERINNPQAEKSFALLNGQSDFVEMVESHLLSLNDFEYLVVCSDGLLPLEQSGDRVSVAKRVISGLRRGGLRTVLGETRTAERDHQNPSQAEPSEASAVGFTFVSNERNLS